MQKASTGGIFYLSPESTNIIFHFFVNSYGSLRRNRGVIYPLSFVGSPLHPAQKHWVKTSCVILPVDPYRRLSQIRISLFGAGSWLIVKHIPLRKIRCCRPRITKTPIFPTSADSEATNLPARHTGMSTRLEASDS